MTFQKFGIHETFTRRINYCEIFSQNVRNTSHKIFYVELCSMLSTCFKYPPTVSKKQKKIEMYFNFKLYRFDTKKKVNYSHKHPRLELKMGKCLSTHPNFICKNMLFDSFPKLTCLLSIIFLSRSRCYKAFFRKKLDRLLLESLSGKSNVSHQGRSLPSGRHNLQGYPENFTSTNNKHSSLFKHSQGHK